MNWYLTATSIAIYIKNYKKNRINRLKDNKKKRNSNLDVKTFVNLLQNLKFDTFQDAVKSWGAFFIKFFYKVLSEHKVVFFDAIFTRLTDISLENISLVIIHYFFWLISGFDNEVRKKSECFDCEYIESKRNNEL